MVSLIETEIMKLKRKKLLWVMLGIAVIMPAFVTYYAAGIPRESRFMDSFKDFYRGSLVYMQMYILPCILGVLGTMMFTDEHKNDTMKQLQIVPVTKAQLLTAKIFMLLLLSIAIMFLTGVLTILGAIVAGGFTDVNLRLILRLFCLCAESGILIPVALMPIILIIAICKKGFVIPVICTVAYALLGQSLVTSDHIGVHPITSMMKIIWYGNFEEVTMGGSITVCIVSLAVIAIVCFITSILILEKQNI